MLRQKFGLTKIVCLWVEDKEVFRTLKSIKLITMEYQDLTIIMELLLKLHKMEIWNKTLNLDKEWISQMVSSVVMQAMEIKKIQVSYPHQSKNKTITHLMMLITYWMNSDKKDNLRY